MGGVAVFDIGKTNLKLVLFDAHGRTCAQRTRPNRPRSGPPWLHPDLADIERWLLDSLRDFAAAHPIAAFVAAAHGSGGVLVNATGPALPPIDYEDEPPAALNAAYARIVPPFPERGASVQDGAVHFGRQLFWMQETAPAAFATARHFLPLPQYWAWRLTGSAALEPTMLGAQSHLWSPLDGRLTSLAEDRGWRHLLPPVGRPADRLGKPLPELGLPADMEVLAGVHDSTANLYRYQAAGLTDLALLSTGTWLVGMTPYRQGTNLDEARCMCVTSDVNGRPVACVLTMCGREHAVIASDAAEQAGLEAIKRVIGKGSMVLPGLTGFSGIFPGTARRGRIVGEVSCTGERAALATLYAALVADACLDLLQISHRPIVIDGGFTADPAFAGLVAALRPGDRVLVNTDGAGTAEGAALLWTHANLGRKASQALKVSRPLRPAGLGAYRERWRAAVAGHSGPVAAPSV